MKRPISFKLVVAWYCVALIIQASAFTRPAKAYQAAGEVVPVFWTFLPLAVLAFVIWQAVGLFQLKLLNRWIAIAFFAGWTLWILWHSVVVLASHSARVFFVTIFFLVLATPNLSCVWYLSRRSFREFASQFRKEKDEELMMRTAQRRVLDEVKHARRGLR